MLMIRKYLLVLFSIFFVSGHSQSSKVDKSVVDEVDLKRYMGTWYEIARFDHKFEQGLQGVTATYSFKDDGKIKVENKGYKGSLSGEQSIAIGKAKLADPKNTSKLKVSFFWIFYGDYFIMELDSDYQWAVIGSSSDKYLWILSRTPQISTEVYQMLLNKVSRRGYDINKLIKVKQP
jgi:lipocalin